MSGIIQPVVYQPEDGESLHQYLQRYTEEETVEILQNPVKLNEFCTLLLTTPWEAKKVTEGPDFPYQKLWSILEKTENYNVLLHHIKIWEPSRKELLKKLSEYASELNKVSTLCTVGRIIGYSTESLSTIIGLRFTESKAESRVLDVATMFGCVGIALTLFEMKISRNVLDNLNEAIERDKKLFAPIQKWYQQSEQIETAMANVFPFDFTCEIVKEFSDIVKGKKEFNRVHLLTSLFKDLLEKITGREQCEEPEDSESSGESSRHCTENERNHLIIQQLVDFMSHPSCKELCEFIFFRETPPILMDIGRMMLQSYHSPIEFIVCQSVRALPSAKQNLFSVPVMGRLIFNGYSLLNDFSRLWSCDVAGVHEMRVLEQHLRGELEALNEIIKIFKKR